MELSPCQQSILWASDYQDITITGTLINWSDYSFMLLRIY